jgi:hypothetical protein
MDPMSPAGAPPASALPTAPQSAVPFNAHRGPAPPAAIREFRWTPPRRSLIIRPIYEA